LCRCETSAAASAVISGNPIKHELQQDTGGNRWKTRHHTHEDDPLEFLMGLDNGTTIGIEYCGDNDSLSNSPSKGREASLVEHFRTYISFLQEPPKTWYNIILDHWNNKTK
jgi:hypothetical protein